MVVVQTDFPRIGRIFCEIPARATLLNGCCRKILRSRMLCMRSLPVILIVQHNRQVKAFPAVIEVGLLKKIGIMLEPDCRAVIEREAVTCGSDCCNANDGIDRGGISCAGRCHHLYMLDF